MRTLHNLGVVADIVRRMTEEGPDGRNYIAVDDCGTLIVDVRLDVTREEAEALRMVCGVGVAPEYAVID